MCIRDSRSQGQIFQAEFPSHKLILFCLAIEKNVRTCFFFQQRGWLITSCAEFSAILPARHMMHLPPAPNFQQFKKQKKEERKKNLYVAKFWRKNIFQMRVNITGFHILDSDWENAFSQRTNFSKMTSSLSNIDRRYGRRKRKFYIISMSVWVIYLDVTYPQRGEDD